MAWETRKRGGLYYTRSHKVGGRVIREYIGRGASGELAAQQDAYERALRRQTKIAWRRDDAQRDTNELGMIAYCAAIDDLARQQLIAAGFHQHARGEWRRKQMKQAKQATPPRRASHLTIPTIPLTTDPGAIRELNRMRELIDGAENGDRETMDLLRPLLVERLGERWEAEYTNVAETLRTKMIAGDFSHRLLMQEAWARQTTALQRDLEGPNATPLERILCERVALCWLESHLADLKASIVAHVAGTPLAVAEYYDKRAARVHKRYLDATLALAKVRRLIAPVMAQVNIAQPGAQQLNIAAARPVA